MKRRKPAGAVFVSVLLAFCLWLAGCGLLASRTSDQNTAQQTIPPDVPYEPPAHWTALTDETFAESLHRCVFSGASVNDDFTYPHAVTALPTPVAVLIYEDGYRLNVGEDWTFCRTQTDRFETTDDLSLAKTVLLVKVRSNRAETEQGGESWLEYSCRVISKDASIAHSVYYDDAFERQGLVTGEQYVVCGAPTPETDDAYFAWLAAHVRFAPDASDDLPLALEFFSNAGQAQASDADHALIRTALAGYDYPEADDLALHPERLDASLPILVYPTDTDLYPDNEAPEDYVRPAALLEDFPDEQPTNCKQSAEVWARALRGETGRLVGMAELYGAHLLDSAAGAGRIYQHLFRVTVIDADTGAAVCWYASEPKTLDDYVTGVTFSSNQLHEFHGLTYWGMNGVPDGTDLIMRFFPNEE